MATEPFLIVGAGAIGSIVGVHLARAGHDVTFVDANHDHVERIRANGLKLIGELETTVRPKIWLPEEATGSFRQVLLAVKSRHTVDALTPIAPLVDANGFVLSLQNGLEEYKIADLVGRERTIGACLTFGGFYVEPGVVKFSGTGSLEIGELDGTMTPRLTALKQALEALQPVTITDNIFGYLWAKMALGAVYFGTAVVDADVVDIYARPAAREVLGRLCSEVVAVADREGVRIESADGFEPTAFRDGVKDAAAVDASWQAQHRYWTSHDNQRTGVWRDLAVHKRKTEVAWQIEPVIIRAAAHGLDVPHLRRLKKVIEEVENGERPLAWENLDAISSTGSS
jgi:2-dehydropantoate 2-reductase